MRTRATAKRALRPPSMKAAATKPKAVAASTTNASWRRAPVRVIAYHAAANRHNDQRYQYGQPKEIGERARDRRTNDNGGEKDGPEGGEPL